MRTRAILECLVVQAEGGGIGDGVEPRAAWPGGYTVQESAGPVTGQKAHQLSVVGFMEGAAYDCGQLSELTPLPHQVRRSQLRDAGRDPGAAVYVPPGRKCGSVGASSDCRVLSVKCLKLWCTFCVFSTEQNTSVKHCVAHRTSNTAPLTLRDAHELELLKNISWLATGALWLPHRDLSELPLCNYTVMSVCYTYTDIILV
jgi:hypothetical protein